MGYKNETPNGINLHVDFQDDISGLWSSNVSFRRVDGTYQSNNYSLNKNFTYYDDLTLSSSETIELLFSELPSVAATIGVNIHDNAGNAIRFDRDINTPYIEIINLDRITDSNYSYTSIQPLIFVSETCNSFKTIEGSQFKDYLVLPETMMIIVLPKFKYYYC